MEPLFGEPDVGIEEYLTPKEENIIIKCTVKHRYSDFIVNEIDEDEKVIVFRSELGNLDKWRASNIKETLPESVKAQLAEIEA